MVSDFTQSPTHTEHSSILPHHTSHAYQDFSDNPPQLCKIRNKEPPCRDQLSELSYLSSGAFPGASASLQYPACYSLSEADGNIQPGATLGATVRQTPQPWPAGMDIVTPVLDQQCFKKGTFIEHRGSFRVHLINMSIISTPWSWTELYITPTKLSPLCLPALCQSTEIPPRSKYNLCNWEFEGTSIIMRIITRPLSSPNYCRYQISITDNCCNYFKSLDVPS